MLLLGLICFTTYASADDAPKDYYDPEIDDLDEILESMPDVAGNMVDEVKRKEILAKHGHEKF